MSMVMLRRHNRGKYCRCPCWETRGFRSQSFSYQSSGTWWNRCEMLVNFNKWKYFWIQISLKQAVHIYYFLLAGNMLGAVKGAGSWIARQYPKAVPLWCTTHQLNRVIVQFCTEPPIRNMIGTVVSVSIFPLYLYLSSIEFIFEKMVSFFIIF